MLGRRRFEQGIFEDVALFPAFLDVVFGTAMSILSVATAVIVTAGLRSWHAFYLHTILLSTQFEDHSVMSIFTGVCYWQL